MKITDSKHRLKELLSITGDSQNEMGRKSGLTKSAISNYINGTREPRQDALLLLSKAYNVNPAWLMGLDVPMRVESDIESNEKLTEAEELYEKYKNAIPEIRNAVDSLLGNHAQDS